MIRALSALNSVYTNNTLVVRESIENGPDVLLYQWYIYFDPVIGNIPQLLIDYKGLYGSSVSMIVTTLRNGTYAPLSGYFSLSFKEAISINIPYNATSNFMSSALNNLSTVGNILVQQVNSNNSYSWLITFTAWDPTANLGKTALLKVNSSKINF